MTVPALVVDIGSENVVALCAEYDDKGDFAVLGVGIQPCEGMNRWRIEEPEELASALSTATDEAMESLSAPLTSVTLGVSSPGFRHYFKKGSIGLQPPGKAISSDDLMHVINHARQVILPSGMEQLQALPVGFEIDGEKSVSRPLGQRGRRLDVDALIVSAPTAEVDALEETVASADLVAHGLVYRPLASALAVSDADERQEGIAILNIDNWTTDVGVFHNGTLTYANTLPLGGAHITHDLATLLNMAFDDADELKREHVEFPHHLIGENSVCEVRQVGSDQLRQIKQSVVCEIAQSRVIEIARLIRKDMERAGYSRLLAAGIGITGDSANIKGIERVIKSEFGDTRVVKKVPKITGQYSRQLNKPEYAAAIGLAFYALNREMEELEPATAQVNWKSRVKAIWSLVGTGR
jgi:cell division protein FtsA